MNKIIKAAVILGLATICSGSAQTLIATVDQNLLPLYLTDGATSANRSALATLLTLKGLTASTTYNYMTGAQTNNSTNPASTSTLPGNAVYITSSSMAYTSSKSLTTTGGYGSFTTDASGSYKGWFGLVTTGGGSGTVFASGKTPYLYLQMSNTVNASILNLRTTDSLTSLGNPNTAGNTANFFYGSATLGGTSVGSKQFFALWDNTGGTGRPLAASWSELDSLSVGTSTDGLLTTSGSFGTYIPTTSKVKRIEFFNVDGTSLGYSANETGFTGTPGNATSMLATYNVGAVNLVPEPSSAMLLIAGSMALIVVRSFRRKQ